MPRAAAWGALVASRSATPTALTNATVLSSSGLGLASALATTVAAHYFFYTHEGAAARPATR